MLRPARFIAVLFLVSPDLFGQQEAIQPPQNQSGARPAPTASGNQAVLRPRKLAKITSRADLVLVPVIVTKSGKHVPGLQKNTFRIEENGKERSISLFEEVQTEKLLVHRKGSAVEGLSNFPAGDEQVWRLTAIVLDMVNTPRMRQLEAKRQLIEFLLRSASRDEPMAIFGLDGTGLHQLHPFSTDTKVLIAAFEKLKLSLSLEEATQPPEVFTDDPSEEQQALDEEQLMSDFMQDLNDAVVADYQRMAIHQTLVSMTQLAHAFQAIPGRKTLIWASAGFPFTIDDPRSFGGQGDDMQTEYQEAWRALNSANIAVYPVDLSAMEFSTRALPSANTGVSSKQINNIRGTNGMKSALNLPYDKSLQQQMTLRSFADATGGRACITVEELEKCFAEAVDDSRAYYLLGYYLEGNTQPGWCKLKVKVVGDGLHIRYRSGFYLAPPVQDSPDLRRRQLADALASPVQYTGLRLTLRLMQTGSDPVSSSGSEQRKPAEFMLGVMGDSITVDRDRGNAVDLEVIAIALDSAHKSVKTAGQSIATELKPERMQRILSTGLGIAEKLDLDPGKYEVKFAVRDNLSGRVGTVSIPAEVK